MKDSIHESSRSATVLRCEKSGPEYGIPWNSWKWRGVAKKTFYASCAFAASLSFCLFLRLSALLRNWDSKPSRGKLRALGQRSCGMRRCSEGVPQFVIHNHRHPRGVAKTSLGARSVMIGTNTQIRPCRKAHSTNVLATWPNSGRRRGVSRNSVFRCECNRLLSTVTS